MRSGVRLGRLLRDDRVRHKQRHAPPPAKVIRHSSRSVGAAHVRTALVLPLGRYLVVRGRTHLSCASVLLEESLKIRRQRNGAKLECDAVDSMH